jgi:predicted dinucleotide-binding enzyme
METIAVIGGTGKEGKGLAYCWARAGYRVLIGSRLAEKALAAAAELQEMLGKEGQVAGMINSEAAEAASILVVTVPFSVHKEMLETIKPYVGGKLVVDVTVPLVPPKVTRVQLPPAGSAAQEAQQILGEGIEIVSAFQNISYEHLIRKRDEPAGPRQGAEAAGPRHPQGVLREGAPQAAASPVGTFVQKIDAAWLKKQLAGQMKFEILTWRSLSVRFMRAVILPALGGRLWLRLLFWLEDLFPHYFGENGQYPLVVIWKK